MEKIMSTSILVGTSLTTEQKVYHGNINDRYNAIRKKPKPIGSVSIGSYKFRSKK